MTNGKSSIYAAREWMISTDKILINHNRVHFEIKHQAAKATSELHELIIAKTDSRKFRCVVGET